MKVPKETRRIALDAIASELTQAEIFESGVALMRAAVDLMKPEDAGREVILAAITFCRYRQEEFVELQELYKKDVSAVAALVIASPELVKL